ncbi:FkbM family methyltransferase, partial [Modestobacter versicolor]
MADRSGTAIFHICPDNEGESSLLGADGGESCQVQVTCLDDLFRDRLPARPRLLKMDAEGVEPAILRGGRRWFDEQGPDMVICEINRGALASAGAGEMEIRDFFAARGYRAALIAIPGAPGLDLGGGNYYRYL